MTSLVLFGATVAMVIALSATLVLLGRAQGDVMRLRRRDTILSTTLAGLGDICFRLVDGTPVRIHTGVSSQAWPREFGDLTGNFYAADRAAVELALAALSANGESFQRRIRNMPNGRMLQVSGQRIATVDAPLDLVWVRDVTEEAAALARLDRAAEQLTLLGETIDNLPLAVWRRDEMLAVISANKRFGAFAELPTLSETLARTARERQAAQTQTQTLRGDTEEDVPLLITETPFHGGTLGVALDRREIEIARAEVTRIVAGHQEVMEAVTTAIAIYGPDARLIFFNSAFGRLWGLDREFLASEPSLAQVMDTLRTQRSLPEYVDYRGFKAEQSALFASLAEPREDLMHLPDGRTIRAKITRHPFGGLTFVYDDVTDRLALESSYNTLMAVQSTTLDNLFEGIAVFGGDGRLKLWNPAFAAMWGLQGTDLSSRPHIAVLVEKARELYDTGSNWDETKTQMIEQVTAYTALNTRLERQDGRVLEVNAGPLPDGNMLMSYQDITDGVHVHRALQERNEALEASSRLKSEFIANVSYELRTPLNAVIGFAEILTNQYFGPLTDRQIEYSRGILHGSHRLMALIDDILDLATIEAGQMALEPLAVDVHGLLAGILSLTRDRAARLHLAIGYDCPPDIGTVRVDEKRIRQALFNLVSNAIKFTPAGGTISLSGRRFGDWIALIVEDTGIGIPGEDQGRIFEKFERRGRRAENTGAGLGLPLVKSFVELHGGRVELASEPGKGTRITCWLPAAPVEGEATSGNTLMLPERPGSSNARNAALPLDESADTPHEPRVQPRRSLSGSV
jgi:signal transduction histidine kinase